MDVGMERGQDLVVACWPEPQCHSCCDMARWRPKALVKTKCIIRCRRTVWLQRLQTFSFTLQGFDCRDLVPEGEAMPLDVQYNCLVSVAYVMMQSLWATILIGFQAIGSQNYVPRTLDCT